MIHDQFGINFYKVLSLAQDFLFFFFFCLWIFGYPFVPASFIEKTILPPLNFFCTIAKTTWHTCTELFLHSASLISVSMPQNIPHNNDYWWYIISLDISWTDFSHLILLFQKKFFFSYSSFCAFPHKF